MSACKYECACIMVGMCECVLTAVRSDPEYPSVSATTLFSLSLCLRISAPPLPWRRKRESACV